jgi:DNA-binding NarL/FixJ family response regulator
MRATIVFRPAQEASDVPSETDFGQEPTRPLSPRELAVLRELTNGATSREIARSLGIAEATVRVHLQNLFGKINARNRTEAVQWALDREKNPSLLTPIATRLG